MDRARSPVGLAVGAAPLAFVLVFFAYPVATLVAEGFDPTALGEVLRDRRIGRVAWFTLWQAVVSTVLTMLAGLPCAYVLARYRFPGAALMRAVVAVPFVLPTIVVGSAFLALVGPAGALPFEMHQTVWAVLAAHVFVNYAVVVRTVGGVWANLDPSLEDAARVLGAGRWTAFRRVTWPRLRPAAAGSALIVFLFTFTSFGIVLVLGGPRLATLEVEIYRQTAQLLDLRMAAALAVLQLLAVTVLLTAYTTAGRVRATRLKAADLVARRPAGNEWAMVAVNGLVVFVGLGAPLVALILRSVSMPDGFGLAWFRGLADTRGDSSLFVPPVEAIRNSLVFAIAATVLALVLGWCSAVVIARRSRGLPRALDILLMLPLAASAVTVGFGFLLALDTPPLDLRTSPVLIPIAHALVGLPFVVRILVPVLRAIDQRLREAAAVLGAPPRRVWRDIDLPMTARAAGVAAGFAFVVSLGEFGATVFIARPDYPTVPLVIFRLLGQPGAANHGQAMAMAAILMVVTTAAVLVVDRLRVGRVGEF